VVQSCRAAITGNCRWLVMPRVPHVGDKPGDRRLEDWFEELPELWELERQGRLVWYNCSTARPLPGSPVVEVRHFSSEAAFGLLGLLGARVLRTLGVDGGRQYASAFDDLAGTTRLRNGQALFDRQFERLAAIAQAHGMDWRPLAEPLAIAVRSDASPSLAAQVLEHTLRRQATQPLAIVHLPRTASSPDGACAVDGAGLAFADPAAADAVAPPAQWLAPVVGDPWLAPHGDGAAAWLDAFADAVAARSIAPAAVRAAVRRRQAHPLLLRPDRWPPASGAAAALRREVAAVLLSRTWQLGELLVRPAAAALRRWRRRGR
jgi:hypothetical protein